MKFLGFLLILIFSTRVLAETVAIPPLGMVKIKAGTYKKFFKEKDKEGVEKINAFFVDKYPVTNKDYLEFVKMNPQWRKSAAPKVFATTNYLQSWPTDLEVPSEKEKHPVVFVSWFAAKKYCEAHGKRLLTVSEWEYAS